MARRRQGFLKFLEFVASRSILRPPPSSEAWKSRGKPRWLSKNVPKDLKKGVEEHGTITKVDNAARGKEKEIGKKGRNAKWILFSAGFPEADNR